MESNQPSEVSELNKSLPSLKEKYDKCVKILTEMQDKFVNINFIVKNTSADNKLKSIHKRELEQYNNMKKIDLTKSLNGKKVLYNYYK